MVLLDLLRRHYEKHGQTDRILVVYVDHNQRLYEEISKDIDAIEEYCLTQELAFEVIELKSRSQSSESALRSARYTALARLAADDERVVFTGHHADDNIETYLFKLIRGAHPDSIKGIMPKGYRKTSQGKMCIARPLLEFTKEDLLTYALGHGLPWHEDSTNQHLFYTRNRIRKELIPVIESIRPGSKERIARFFDDLVQQNKTKTPSAEKTEKVAQALTSKDGYEILGASFSELKTAIDSLLDDASSRTTRAHWTNVQRQLQQRQLTKRCGGPTKQLQFPGDHILRFQGSRLFWVKNSRHN